MIHSKPVSGLGCRLEADLRAQEARNETPLTCAPGLTPPRSSSGEEDSHVRSSTIKQEASTDYISAMRLSKRNHRVRARASLPRSTKRVAKADERRQLVCCDACNHRKVPHVSPDTIKWHREMLDSSDTGKSCDSRWRVTSCHDHCTGTRKCDMCGGGLDGPLPGRDEHGYPCHICKTKLLSVHKLVAHSVQHTGVKPFFCACCPRNFTRRERMSEHVVAFHREAVE